MEKKEYHLNEVIYSEGDKINELLVVVTGECSVSMLVDQYNLAPDDFALTEEDGLLDQSETTVAATTTHISPLGAPKKLKVDLGRIGPYSFLGTEMASSNDFQVDFVHTETVKAGSLVVIYSVAKNDFFHHLRAETRNEILRLIKCQSQTGQLLPHIWDTVPVKIGEKDLKIATTWQRFRKALAEDKTRSRNILVNMRSLDSIHFAGVDLRDHNKEHFATSTTATAASESELYANFGVKRSVGNLQATKIGGDGAAAFASPFGKFRTSSFLSSTMEMNAKREALSLKREQLKKKELERASSTESLTSSSFVPSAPLLRFPFVLIHVHREPVKARGGIASRRLVSCHMRICGTQPTCAACKDSASFQIKTICLTYFRGDPSKEESLFLKWRTFTGYDNMPLQHTDHFIIYCRNAPLEYASLTISEDTLSMKMPSACRPRGQVFCCVSMRSLRPPGKVVPGEGLGFNFGSGSVSGSGSGSVAGLVNDESARNRVRGDFDLIGLPETSEFVQENSRKQIAVPLFMMELSIVDEVLAASSSFIDCLRFALSISPQPYPLQRPNESEGPLGTGEGIVDAGNDEALSVTSNESLQERAVAKQERDFASLNGGGECRRHYHQQRCSSKRRQAETVHRSHV
jgi:hypothetical protein